MARDHHGITAVASTTRGTSIDYTQNRRRSYAKEGSLSEILHPKESKDSSSVRPCGATNLILGSLFNVYAPPSRRLREQTRFFVTLFPNRQLARGVSFPIFPRQAHLFQVQFNRATWNQRVGASNSEACDIFVSPNMLRDVFQIWTIKIHKYVF